jgi:hypothetical protein
MAKRTQHVIPSSGGWGVKASGASRLTKHFDTKEPAISYGESLSSRQKTVLFIHKKDGTIQNRRSYSSDSQTITKR